MWLYRLLAVIIMPRQHHQESRNLRARSLPIPTLYVMGEEDHMFLALMREKVARDASSSLTVIEPCGHVCRQFNRRTLAFIQSLGTRG